MNTEEKCDPHTFQILRLVAFFYQTYFRYTAFEAISKELEKILGDAAYGVIVRIVSNASIKAVPTMAKNMGYRLENGDKLAALAELNKKCHVELYNETSKVKGLGDIGLILVEYDKENKRVKFEIQKCPRNLAAAAPYVGIVVGISKSMGLDVVAISEPSQKSIVKSEYVAYPVLKSDENKCYIVVEKVK